MDTTNLRAIASAQRWQIIATLFLIASAVAWVTSKDVPGVLPEFFTPGILQSITCAAVAVLWFASLMLARSLHGGTGFLATWVLCTIPPINLFAWYGINSRASSLLRAAGAKVGFFGASSSSLP